MCKLFHARSLVVWAMLFCPPFILFGWAKNPAHPPLYGTLMNPCLFMRSAIMVLAILIVVPLASAQVPPTHSIAKEAFIYGFPMVAGYETLYKQAVDKSNAAFVAPFNTIGHSTRVATPKDTQFVTPNSDTPYSYVWMDLRAEPVVITMPKIDKDRYYTAQLVDLYTFNFGYLGSRAYGNDGGDFLIAGPEWKGEKPKGIKAVIASETEFAYALLRTQLFNPSDLKNVQAIQSGYKAQTLSQYLGAKPPAAAPIVNWPKPEKGMTETSTMFSYLNFLLQFCPTHPTEKELMSRLASLQVGAGKSFDASKLPPATVKAVDEGIADAWVELEAERERINSGEHSSMDVFGNRAFLNGDYLRRFIAAKLGIYGNSKEEAVYPPYFVDSQKRPLDASSNRYVLRFEKDQLPPAAAFWSLTMYDGKTQLLVDNPLQRYLLNSSMGKSFQYGEDGSLTLYLQKDSPGAKLESNWLPAPAGPFYAIMRIYLPKTEVLDGRWKQPALTRVTSTEAPMAGTPVLQTVDTRIGKLEFERGYPSQQTVKTLFDQMDFQRASQAYLWSLPLMGFAQWQQQHEQVFNAKDTDLVM